MRSGIKKLFVFVLAAALMLTTAGGFADARRVYADQDSADRHKDPHVMDVV